ncbi:MAG: SemiSWEET family sugar transporter [Hyphomicrobiaceae bacterium]
MLDVGTLVGSVAAICTTFCNVPQVIKVFRTRETEDLSLKMLLLLNSGLALWIVYGFIKDDWIIYTANMIGISLTGYLLAMKLAARLRSR